MTPADAAVIDALPAEGSRTRATVRPDGTLRVEEWVRSTSSGRGADGTHRTFAPSATAQASSSVPGRALARITPSRGTTAGPRIVTVTASSVLSLACLPPGAGAVPRPCGSPDSTATRSWTVRLDQQHADETVLAQVDLR